MLSKLRSGLTLGVRSVATSCLLGHRLVHPRQREEGDEAPGRLLTRIAKLAADEAFLTTELMTGPLISSAERRRVVEEIETALRVFAHHDWLDDPARFHRPPPPLMVDGLEVAHSWGLDYQHLTFTSGFEPHRDVPGAARWLSHAPNRRGHAWLLQHDGAPRPWLVCVPGYRMGTPTIDFVGFRAAWLHRELGLNVAIPVLPFHGPRAHRRSGDGFLRGDLMDTLHAQSQAVWDVRSVIGHLRRELEAPDIGLYGISLGAYTSGIVAGLEPDLRCAIAGIPASNWVDLLRSHVPESVVKLSERMGFPWCDAQMLLGAVSPLALAPAVPRDRLYVFAARSDRLAPPGQARDLWEHWQRPEIAWYDGGHVSFMIEPAVEALIRRAVSESGLGDVQPIPDTPPTPRAKQGHPRPYAATNAPF